MPDFVEEINLWNKGLRYIAGVDEVGRGCFAGPVTAAAVVLSPDFDTKIGVNDSKLLSSTKRKYLSEYIIKNAVTYSIATVPVAVINEVGIGKATQIAFYKAVKGLSVRAEFILVDAFYIRKIDQKKQKAIIHGDRMSLSIAAASIIAKVYRDRLMASYQSEFPQYNFSANKGYGTRRHREALKKYGLSSLHRTSFDLARFLE